MMASFHSVNRYTLSRYIISQYSFSMNHIQLRSFSLHLLLFVIIEIIFVFLLFREIPETNIFSAIGIGHTIYRVVLIWAALCREKAKKIWQRFLATYTPVLAHLVIHFRVGAETLYAHETWTSSETIWTILWVIVVWVLIYRWEYLLHTKFHCDTHHQHVHKSCYEHGHHDCEEKHKQNNW